MTRQAFLLALPEALLAKALAAETARPKLLLVAAHPDDEYLPIRSQHANAAS